MRVHNKQAKTLVNWWLCLNEWKESVSLQLKDRTSDFTVRHGYCQVPWQQVGKRKDSDFGLASEEGIGTVFLRKVNIKLHLGQV